MSQENEPQTNEQSNNSQNQSPGELKSDMLKGDRIEEAEAEDRTRQATVQAERKRELAHLEQDDQIPVDQKMGLLRSLIIDQLKQQLSFEATVYTYMNEIIVTLSDSDYDRSCKQVRQDIENIINQNFQNREDNISVSIRCEDVDEEKVFKIWKTA